MNRCCKEFSRIWQFMMFYPFDHYPEHDTVDFSHKEYCPYCGEKL